MNYINKLEFTIAGADFKILAPAQEGSVEGYKVRCKTTGEVGFISKETYIDSHA
jgi:hypothetical protein